jgi:hypothetical protein
MEVGVAEQQRQVCHDPGIAASRASTARRVIKFLLALMATLERQGLRLIAVLIEDAANGPAVCKLLSARCRD